MTTSLLSSSLAASEETVSFGFQYLLGQPVFDDEPIIKAFIVAEILEFKEMTASQEFVSFRYAKLPVEVSH